ncbi:MAG: peptidoglycan editing factor PgeF, partial [Ignavibacteriae bacterium HGW-Ignavibacteriae-3]
AIQKQTHSDIITIVEKPGMIGESDAIITAKAGIGLAVSSADCVPSFIYDKKKKLVSGIHSGWRGTQRKILLKTILELKKQFNSDPIDLFVFVGPSISQKNYEVGEDVASQFDQKYSLRDGGKIYLDVLQANIDMLHQAGIPDNQIEVSPLCSFEEKDLLHSYRREGDLSGRALGIIAMKDN